METTFTHKKKHSLEFSLLLQENQTYQAILDFSQNHEWNKTPATKYEAHWLKC